MTNRNWSRYEGVLAFVFLATCFAILFPELFFLNATPMSGSTWALKDPTVSWSAYMPAFREFRHELFEHGNILWSTLRGMGQPILGNGVQGAPLFPLNIALVWLPDTLYWSVMPILRLLLIALGLYIVARRIFGLNVLTSLVFALLAGFNFNITRWINHPWSFGLLAGLWYFYFVCRISLPTKSSNSYMRWHCVGLVLAVQGMITNGFPEAAAFAALLALILYLGFLVANWSSIKPSLRANLVNLIQCHLIGFGISAIQLFALIEYIDFSRTMDLREGLSGGTYTSEQRLPYALAQFSIFSINKSVEVYTSFYVGLVGFYFALRGAFSALSGASLSGNQRIKLIFAATFLVSMALFVLKAFGLSSALEWVFQRIPVLGQSHFPLYYSPLFFFGIAYFAALGVDSFFTGLQGNWQRKTLDIIISVIAVSLIFYISIKYASHFNDTEPEHFFELFAYQDAFSHLRSFALLALVLILCIFASMVPAIRGLAQRNKTALSTLAAALLIAFILFEQSATLPKQFAAIEDSSIFVSQTTSQTLEQALSSAPVPHYELRGRDSDGDFVSEGLATADNGASAILPPDTRQLRLSLFDAAYGGYIYLENPKAIWSWGALSSNFIEVHTTPKVDKDWQGYTPDPLIQGVLGEWKNTPQPLANPFYLQGSASGRFIGAIAPEQWLKFEANDTHFWVQANIRGYQHRGLFGDRHRMDSRWRIRIPADLINAEEMQVTLRQVDPNSSTYFDAKPEVLTFDKNHSSAIASKNYQLLSHSEDNSRLFYYNPDALPRAYIASSCEVLESQKDQMSFFTDTDAVMFGRVILEKDDNWPSDFCANYKNTFKRVAISSDSGTKITFASIQGPALLIVNDTFYPGWTAKDVSDKTTSLTIRHANTAIRSVYLPEAREYKIEMRYKPSWMIYIYIALGLSMLLFIHLWVKLGRHAHSNTKQLEAIAEGAGG